MQTPRFIDRVSRSFSESIVERLKRNLHYPSLMALVTIALLFALAWASIAAWTAIRSRTELTSTSVSLIVAVFFALVGFGVYFVRQGKIKNADSGSTSPKHITHTEAALMRTEVAESKSKELIHQFEEKAGDATDLIKRGVDEVTTWVRENPINAAFIGLTSGLLVGMLARRFFASEGKTT